MSVAHNMALDSLPPSLEPSPLRLRGPARAVMVKGSHAVRVRLTDDEVDRAILEGGRRYYHHLRNGRPQGYGATDEDAEDPWGRHIKGALGELALAVALDRSWPNPDSHEVKKGDVGILEVRALKCHHYDLMLRPEDHDDVAFILVTGHVPPEFIIHGWVVGGDGKRGRELCRRAGQPEKRPPAYWVKQRELRPLAELRDLLRRA